MYKSKFPFQKTNKTLQIIFINCLNQMTHKVNFIVLVTFLLGILGSNFSNNYFITSAHGATKPEPVFLDDGRIISIVASKYTYYRKDKDTGLCWFERIFNVNGKQSSAGGLGIFQDVNCKFFDKANLKSSKNN